MQKVKRYADKKITATSGKDVLGITKGDKEFSDMIDEYVHFNDSARNSIMERMTPDYMVVGIGSKTESYKYKSEIISDETAFYTNEKNGISGICNQSEAVEGRVSNMLSELQHMYTL